MLTRDDKRVALFVRNTLRHALRRHFRQMLSRLTFKKVAFPLLTSKRKRSLEEGFLRIRECAVRSSHKEVSSCLEKYSEGQLLAKLVEKLLRRRIVSTFSIIKNMSTRQRKLQLLSTILAASSQRLVERLFFREAFARMRAGYSRQQEKLLWVRDIVRVGENISKRLQHWAFDKITDSLLVEQCVASLHARKNKNEEMKEASLSRKEWLAKVREKMKAMKAEVDQQRQEKNKVSQERKKYQNSHRLQMMEGVRRFEKERKAEEAVFREIEGELEERERRMEVRNDLREKATRAQVRCHELFAVLQGEEDEVKNLASHVPMLSEELEEFAGTATAVYRLNAINQKLVEVFEKRGDYHYEEGYYDLQYENNVVRETARCFVKERLESWAAQQHRQRSFLLHDDPSLAGDMSWT